MNHEWQQTGVEFSSKTKVGSDWEYRCVRCGEHGFVGVSTHFSVAALDSARRYIACVSKGARPLQIDRQYINQRSALAPFLNEKADEFERFHLSQITLPTAIVVEVISQMEESLQELWASRDSHATEVACQHHDTLRRLRGMILVGMLDRFLRCFQ